MNFVTNKNVGCIGALIITFGTILVGASSIFTGINAYGILGIVGLITILVSLYNLSSIYQAKNIFTNARIGIVVAILGHIVIIGFTVVSPVISDLRMLFLFLGIITMFATIAVIFVRRSLNELAACSGVGTFASASKLLFIGAILSIIGVGVLLMWIAIVGIAIAFFQMKESAPTSPSQTTPTTAETNALCPNCGNPILPDNVFCPNCGKQIQTQPT